MALNVLPSTSSKRQRIMIITADEDIISQIENTNDARLMTQILLETKAGNGKNNDQQTIVPLPEKKNKTKHGKLTCVICGSSASGHNFGAISCESCKAFFRRNALKHPDIFQCRNKRDCEIRYETRRDCTACRLAKCYSSGMRRDRLSTNEQRAEKRRRIEENRILTSNSNSINNEQQLPTAASDDLLRPIDTDVLFLTDFSDQLPPQAKQVSFSPDDLQRVETISVSYKKRIELANRDGLPWDPSMHATTYLQILNGHSVPIMRLLSFFKQIPEFNQLNVDDKVTLIKYNHTIVLYLNRVLSYDKETGQIIETDFDVPFKTEFFQILHGYDIFTQTKKIFNSFLHIANYDRKIIELSLLILILAKGISTTDSHEPLLNDTMAIYRAQNDYVELLWNYMEATHGSEVATRSFSKLIIQVLAWQKIQEDIRNNILRILSPEDIDELLPIMRSVLHLS